MFSHLQKSEAAWNDQPQIKVNISISTNVKHLYNNEFIKTCVASPLYTHCKVLQAAFLFKYTLLKVPVGDIRYIMWIVPGGVQQQLENKYSQDIIMYIIMYGEGAMRK